MKKNRFIKIITIIILGIAAFSLIFGSAIMLLGNNNQETINGEDITNEIDEQGNIDEESYDISAEDNNVEIEILDESIE